MPDEHALGNVELPEIVLQKFPLYTADIAALAGTVYAELCELRQADQAPSIQQGVAVWLDDEGLQLINAAVMPPLRLRDKELQQRWRGGSLLAQACGVKRGGHSVLDPFAGFGLDALTLVHGGNEVSAGEKHPLVWLMQTEFAQRMQLALDSALTDAVAFMRQTERQWDIVYLDPMFPARRKRALPNLALQHLQQLTLSSDQSAQTEPGADIELYLSLAKAHAQRRVVLKRRVKDPTIGQPAHQLSGQAVRFDVYL